jgi:hypothetical protein
MSDYQDRVAHRGAYSLAAQVIYQCRVMSILRDDPDRAPELLRNPVLMQQTYEARWGEPIRGHEGEHGTDMGQG